MFVQLKIKSNFYLTFEINQIPMKENEVPTSNETDHNVTPGNV